MLSWLLAFSVSSWTATAAVHAFPAFAVVKKPTNVAGHKAASSDEGAQEFPDYGKTPVQIDTIVVEKKRRSTTTAESDSNPWRRSDLFGTSLVQDTLASMESDQIYQETAQRYAELGGQKGVTKEERLRTRRALNAAGIPSFNSFVRNAKIQEQENEPAASSASAAVIQRKQPAILQLNVGLYCNQACSHCHVESSPLRVSEMMNAETAAQCLGLLKKSPLIHTLDITGGAPELNSSFRYLVTTARQLRPNSKPTGAASSEDCLEIIDRCNLTVLQEPGQEDLVEFLASNKVHVVASLPCYSEANVNQQRGSGVFERSIAALLALNEAGYGKDDNPDLQLDLVYNPAGAFLPPPQAALEVQYKEQLKENFGISFNKLYTITNMPIKRFADYLYRRDELSQYMDLLVRNFNIKTLDSVMCTDLISVGYDGKIYDCDFNQQLGYTIVGNGASVETAAKRKEPLTVFDIESYQDLLQYKIYSDNHCFGCTAGAGSSCQGTVA
jgi:radical SAM/Cys-rich protein